MQSGQALGLWWEPCPAGARVLRVEGDTPCPELPAAVEGLPVAELGPYCFAESPRPLPAAARHWGEQGGEPIAGRFVESVGLPDTVHTLHSGGFYNCRRLRSLSVGAGIAALGSDLFTNCRALTALTVRAAPGAATGLRRLLGALSGDVEVTFAGNGRAAARLFYPEYWEVLDENAPAHLFDRAIEGEGYRYRQCFAAGAVDYPAYDAAFPRAAVGESPAKLCRLALGRLLWPYALTEAARARYERYLQAHTAAALGLATAERDASALRQLLALGLPAAEAAGPCAAAGWSEGAALALGAAAPRGKKRFDFDD